MHLRKPEIWPGVQLVLIVAVFALMAAQVGVEIGARHWGAAAGWIAFVVVFDGVRNSVPPIHAWLEAQAEQARADAEIARRAAGLQERLLR